MLRFLVVSLTVLSVLSFSGRALEVVEVNFSETFSDSLENEFGMREAEILREIIARDLYRVDRKTKIPFSRAVVTIEAAKPNKPTLEQLSGNPGLSYSGSFGVGGMTLNAIFTDSNGRTSRAIHESWFGDDIQSATHLGTWGDARRASRRFAKKLKKAIEEDSLFEYPGQKMESGQQPG